MKGVDFPLVLNLCGKVPCLCLVVEVALVDELISTMIGSLDEPAVLVDESIWIADVSEL